MNVKILGILLLITFLTSCQNWQYNVYVTNNTGEIMTIKYKSQHSEYGSEEQTVKLNPGESQTIRLTGDVTINDNDTKECEQVADYFDAYLGNQKSSIDWCDDRFKMEVVDIGQKEYQITYSNSDF